MNESVTKTLRILFIGDSQDEVESIIKWLQKEIPDIHYERVNKANALQDLLARSDWDLIVSDFNLQCFSVLEALEIIKEQLIDVPFIVVSGPVKDTDIIGAMKAGVHDFIPKTNLSPLLASIQNEMKNAGYRLRQESSQRDLRHEKDSSESANKRKSRVLAFVAHEFRNPLNALLMFGELLEKESAGPLSEKQKEYVQSIRLAGQHLKDMVNDILDIGPIETGHFKVSLEKTSLPDIVSTVKSLVQGSAEQKNITLAFEIGDGIEWIQADPKRLKQILINLMSNAIKYTSKNDTVSLKIFREANQWIVYEILDHGPGIEKQELKNLCSDYYRIKNTFSSQEEGLGLGLAVTKKLVEAHQGIFNVDSTLGKGSTFSVKLPIHIIDGIQNNMDT